MVSWQDSSILLADRPIVKQDRFFDWVEDNVDFGVRAMRVGQ
jgi:hypothetical protein